MRFVRKLLLINILAACGAPGSDSVFTSGKAKSDTPAPATPAPRPAPRVAPKTVTGYFRVVGMQPQFQPCGTARPIDIYGSPSFMARLKERIRFSGVWEGRKYFAQLLGTVVTDTVPSDSSSDSVRAGPRTRFNFVEVDSLRPWRNSDCGGMSVR